MTSPGARRREIAEIAGPAVTAGPTGTAGTAGTVLAYSGGVIDQAANQRSDPGWIDATLAEASTLIVKPRRHPVDNAKVIHRSRKTARAAHPGRRMLTEWYKHSPRVTISRAPSRIPVSRGNSAARTASPARRRRSSNFSLL